MSKELERARQELSKKYRNTIHTLEEENKKLKEENERLQKERDKAIVKYSKLVIYNNLSAKDQERILSDDGVSKLLSNLLKGSNIPLDFTPEIQEFDLVSERLRNLYKN
jgi:hypothetical protein